MTPQEIAEACGRAMWNDDHASQSLGMTLERIAPGEAALSMTVTPHMANGHGSCHGGYIFSLADSAFAFACNSHGQRTVAQHCSITYVRPGVVGEKLVAVARELSRTGRSGIYDVHVTRQDGTVVAEFRGHSRTLRATLLPGNEQEHQGGDNE